MKLKTSDKVEIAIIASAWILLIYILVGTVIQEQKYQNLEELRPCPFCGSTNIEYDEWSDGIEMHDDVQDYDIATVECKDCRAEIHTYWHENDNAKSRWNRRK